MALLYATVHLWESAGVCLTLMVTQFKWSKHYFDDLLGFTEAFSC